MNHETGSNVPMERLTPSDDTTHDKVHDIAVAVDAKPPGGNKRPASKKQRARLSLPQVLDATQACLTQQGYDGTKIREIATRLGCAVGSIYRYFPDKRALLDAVTQRLFEPVAQAVEQAEPPQRTLAQYVAIAVAEPQQYRLMFWLASVNTTTNAHDVPEVVGVPGVVTRIIEGWSRQIGDPQRARQAWAQLHGYLMLGIHQQQIIKATLPLLQQRQTGETHTPASQPAEPTPHQPAFAAERAPERAPERAQVVLAAAREDVTLL